MFAVIGILAALTEARTSGRGQEIDVAIYEAVNALMESSMADFELGGVLRERLSAASVRDRPIAVAVEDDRRRSRTGCLCSGVSAGGRRFRGVWGGRAHG